MLVYREFIQFVELKEDHVAEARETVVRARPESEAGRVSMLACGF